MNGRLGWIYGTGVFLLSAGSAFLIGGIWKDDIVRVILGSILLVAAIAIVWADRRRRQGR